MIAETNAILMLELFMIEAPLWSALTCQRFAPGRLDALIFC
jgi:hypothetical protein